MVDIVVPEEGVDIVTLEELTRVGEDIVVEDFTGLKDIVDRGGGHQMNVCM